MGGRVENTDATTRSLVLSQIPPPAGHHPLRRGPETDQNRTGVLGVRTVVIAA